jgi:hypothetical protein
MSDFEKAKVLLWKDLARGKHSAIETVLNAGFDPDIPLNTVSLVYL